jgi:hypothetical protein
VYMNYEKFKRSDRPDRFRSLTTVNHLHKPAFYCPHPMD